MFALTTALMSLIGQVSGTPYIPGGDTPAGTDCSGLASWVANVASGRPAFGSRFNTGNMESALLARGFRYGTAPDSVVIGWNGGHAAVTLPDGTPVSSGESGSGVRIGGGGAYQPQFTNHMYLPVDITPDEPETAETAPAAEEPAAAADPGQNPESAPAAGPEPEPEPAPGPTPDLVPEPAPGPTPDLVPEPAPEPSAAQPAAQPPVETAADPADPGVLPGPEDVPPIPV